MKTFPHHKPFEREIQRSRGDSFHKGRWRGAVMFSLICGWTNGWANSRKASDLRRNRSHYDSSAMFFFLHQASRCKYFRLNIKNCFMIYDCLSSVCLQNKWVLCHKQVSRAWTRNYASHILRGVITGPCTALISAFGTPLLKWIPRNLFCGRKQAIYNEFRA